MLARRDPFREMLSLRNTMDRLFDNFMMEPTWSNENMGMAMDVSENDNEFLVKASLPGVKPEDIDITLNNNTLTIKGESKSDEEKEGEHYHMRERRFGTFSRSISLPNSVKADDISANYEDGILTLRLPKAEEAKPRRIEVKGSKGKVIEAKAK